MEARAPGRGLVSAVTLDLGLAEYEAVWARQLALVEARQADLAPDTLILVEHPHVVTLGRRREARRNVLAEEMPVVEVERGGDVTYHGPGQLVGYPICKLDDAERDVHALLRNLEAGLIAVCSRLGIEATRRPAYTGVWVGERKLASLGVAIRQWVSFHGFALNVCTDLSRFSAINPCGLDAGVMTSLEALLGRPISVEEVKPLVIDEVGRALGRDFGHDIASTR
jgi:lipoate-protein ligase B